MENPSAGKTALGLDVNVGSLLCYLPICGVSLIYSIIVLVTDKTNKVVRFHAFQSLILSGVWIISFLVVGFIGGFLVAATESGILGLLVTLLYFGVIIVFLGLMIMGMVKAYQGSSFKLPIIGDMADKWSN